jgi:hypothetical protein
LGYNPRNWNAIELLGRSRILPLDSQFDVVLGKLKLNEGLKFRVFHTPTGGSADVVDCGQNWAALRAISRFGGKPVDASGQVWRVPLKPGEPTAVWIQLAFEQPLPPAQNWPTLDTLGLRDLF